MFSLRTKTSILRAVLTKRSPFYIQFYVSARCNLRCRHCGIVHTNASLKEVSLSDVRKIVDNLVKIGAGVVVLMGGEPFLRKDYPDIIRIFIEHKLDVRLQTAGMKVATPEMLRLCVEAGAKDINVSLDSLDSDKQDYINNCRGSWDQAIKTIANISNIFPKMNSLTSFGTVISAFNFIEIPAILELATEIGWHLSLVPVHITTPDVPMAYRSVDQDFLVKDNDFPELEAVFSKLKEMRKNGYKLFDSSKYLDSALVFMKTNKPTWRNNDICDSPYLYFVIRPDGNFAICADHQFKDNPVSTIDSNFPKIYKDKEFRRRIREVTKGCPGCQYGSYPEMSISTRSLSGIFERFKTFINVKTDGIVPCSYEELIGKINKIKEKYSYLYGPNKDPHKYNNALVTKWKKSCNIT